MTRLHQPGQAVFRAILPEDIEWKPFPAFPPTVRLAVIVGEPSKPGPYVIRVKAPPGVTLMPEDRIYTVVSAVFYICLGGRFDGDKVKACPPGSVNDRRAKRRRDPCGRSGASGRVQTVTQLIPETRHPSTRSSDDRLRPHQPSGERRVGVRRGGVRPGIAVPALVRRCLSGSRSSVSTPSSNRTCRSPASGSRTRPHALRPRHVVPAGSGVEPEAPVEVRRVDSLAPSPPDFVLEAQPPAQPPRKHRALDTPC